MLTRFDTSVFTKHTLSNGIPVFIQEPRVIVDESCMIEVVLKDVGSTADPVALPGLAHLTEHILFFGSQKYPSELEITAPFLQQGGYINGRTDLEHMVIYGVTHRESIETSLDILRDITSFPLFYEEHLCREKTVVQSEYEGMMSDDNEVIRELFQGYFFLTPAHQHLPIGNVSALKNAASSDLQKFHSDYFHAGNYGIVCAGFLPRTQKLLDLLEDYFGGMTRKDPAPYLTPVLARGEIQNSKLSILSQEKTILSYPLGRLSGRDRYILALLRNCLTGDSDAPLPQELRFKRGLVYETNLCEFFAGRDYGYFQISLPVNKENFCEAENLALAACRSLSEAWFQKFKTRLLQNRRMIFLHPLDAAERAVNSFILELDCPGLAEEEKEIASISWDELKSWMEKILNIPSFIFRVMKFH